MLVNIFGTAAVRIDLVLQLNPCVVVKEIIGHFDIATVHQVVLDSAEALHLHRNREQWETELGALAFDFSGPGDKQPAKTQQALGGMKRVNRGKTPQIAAPPYDAGCLVVVAIEKIRAPTQV